MKFGSQFRGLQRFLKVFYMITQRLSIRGRVQGVGYRDALRDEALRRGLAGWVRNRADGSVEALVQGAEAEVRELVAWAQRGPPAARVAAIHVEALGGEPTHTGFERRPTL
jgi:acylphosphatase